MRVSFGQIKSFVLCVGFISAVFIGGCSARVSTGYRVHDGYYGDDHVWDNNEVVYYNRWEGETHRKHEDFRHRNANDQKEYWTWRHNQH